MRSDDSAATREERALDLLVQSSRVDPKLREAVAEVEKWVRRLQEDRSSAWQSYEEADVEAQYQMGQKLEAQTALLAITRALDLDLSSLGHGWAEGSAKILYRIEEIVDEGERGFKERDSARHLAKHLFQMIGRDTWRATGGDDGQGHYEGDYRAAGIEEEIRSWTK